MPCSPQKSRYAAAVLGVALALSSTLPAAAARKPKPDPLQQAIAAILAEPELARGHWGIQVVALDSGRDVFSLNADKLFTPASNTKLFTTAAAFALVGGDYRFRTTVESAAHLDKHGRLAGDLLLVGRGDPNLSDRVLPWSGKEESSGSSTRALEAMADALVKQGLKQVDGDVVGDDTFYDSARYPEGWDWDDLQYDYGAPVSALTVNDNLIAMQVQPGDSVGAPAFLSPGPLADYYVLHNQAVTIAAGGRNSLDLRREPGSREVTFFGEIPLDQKPHTEFLAVEDSAEFAAKIFRHLLEQRGVAVLGQARARHRSAKAEAPSATNVLAETLSHPLAEDLTIVNKVSQNLHAELALRLIGATHLPRGSAISPFDAGLDQRREFLKAAGIAEDEAVLTDGSGLSRLNLVSPAAVIKLLRHAAAQSWGPAFAATLPIAGVDGSLARRFAGTPANGATSAAPSPAKERVQAKTGSLSHVNALSGYATTLAGERLAFAIFSNSQARTGKPVISAIDRLVEAIVVQTQPPPPAKGRHKPRR